MAKQTLKSWGLAVLAAFNKAGATAMAAGPVGLVAMGGEDIWHRVLVFIEFAAATWILAGVHGVAVYISADPVPYDDDGTGDAPKATQQTLP